LKYFPSINKIKQKLREKFWPESEKGKKYWGIFEDDIEFIVNEKMWNILVEKQIITSTINNYINKWKNIFYIKSKLYEKWFKKEEFEKNLVEEFDIENSSILNYEKIFKQIQVLFKKNKSRNFIRNKFVENSFDAEIVDSILDEIFVDWESELLKNELEKILRKSKVISCWAEGFNPLQISKLNYQEKQKIIQKLLSKWFWYSEIKNVMWI
jgi:SOS response regulatory protein OraA/RecX